MNVNKHSTVSPNTSLLTFTLLEIWGACKSGDLDLVRILCREGRLSKVGVENR